MIQVNEDKDTTFDLKDAESDDEDYKGDIKSKDYENEKLQIVEKLTSPSAPSPDDSEKVKKQISKNPNSKDTRSGRRKHRDKGLRLATWDGHTCLGSGQPDTSSSLNSLQRLLQSLHKQQLKK